MKIALILAAVLHFGFFALEMIPWSEPIILKSIVETENEKPDQEKIEFSDTEKQLVANIVHNAGVYNLIVAMGFVWCLVPSLFGGQLDATALRSTQCFFFTAALVAGLFGLTLSLLTGVQAGVGLIGLLCLVSGKPAAEVAVDG
jgi:uncharacterized membrane protein